jgi:hypothetical protein
VPTFDHVPGEAPSSLVERFELAYTDERSEQRVPLTEALSVPFESCSPVRGFPSYKGQRRYVGRSWRRVRPGPLALVLG